MTIKRYLTYVCLQILAMAGLSLYILVDTYFVANGVGTYGLAALNLAIPVFNLISGFAQMTGIGAATRYTILTSQQREDEANTLFSQAVILGALGSFILMMTGLLLSRPIAYLLGANSDTFTMTHTYLMIILLFSPAFVMNQIFSQFTRNDHHPKQAAIASLIGSLANIIFDYILIFPCHMGITGAVLATGFSPLISITILSFQKRSFSLQMVKPSLSIYREICALGFPMLVTEVSSGLVMALFNILIVRAAGTIGVAAYGIIANIAIVTIVLYNGLAQGVQPLFAEAYGSQNSTDDQKLRRYALISLVVIASATYLILTFNASVISSLFDGGHLILRHIAVSGIRLYFTNMPFLGFNILISLYFTTHMNTRSAHIISLTRGFILIMPIVILMASLFGMTGIFLSTTLCEALVSLIALRLYTKKIDV